MKFSPVVFVTLLVMGLLSGCLAAPTPTLETEAPVAYQIKVLDVVVEPGVKVELSGNTSLPEGNCVYTQLVQNNTAVEWWPVGKCFPVAPPDWAFSIPLAVEGAPQTLEPDVDYCIRVWWPGAPSITLAEYHFDLSEP